MKTNDSNLILSTGKSLRFLNSLLLSADRRIRRLFGRGFAIGSVAHVVGRLESPGSTGS